MDYLERFFQQGIFPSEELSRPSDAKYEELETQCALLQDELIKNLSEEQKKLFDQIMEVKQHLGIFDMTVSFSKGFGIGGRLVNEIYNNTRDNKG